MIRTGCELNSRPLCMGWLCGYSGDVQWSGSSSGWKGGENSTSEKDVVDQDEGGFMILF